MQHVPAAAALTSHAQTAQLVPEVPPAIPRVPAAPAALPAAPILAPAAVAACNVPPDVETECDRVLSWRDRLVLAPGVACAPLMSVTGVARRGFT
eukprot:1559465-Pleurochrysis_carterae.AAC.2